MRLISEGFWRRFGSDRRLKIFSELAPDLLLLIIGIIGTVREADCSECSESATEESLYVTAAVRSAKWMARPYLCVSSIERENCATHLLAVALIGVESASQANVGVGSHDQNLLVFRPLFQWGVRNLHPHNRSDSRCQRLRNENQAWLPLVGNSLTVPKAFDGRPRSFLYLATIFRARVNWI